VAPPVHQKFLFLLLAQVQTGELLFHLAGDGQNLLQAVRALLAQVVKLNVPSDAGVPFFVHFTMQDNRFILHAPMVPMVSATNNIRIKKRI
jgi:hypothetical protein